MSLRYEGKSAFQTIANELHKKSKKTHKITNKLYWARRTTKTDEEIYVLSSVKVYSYFSYNSVLCQKRFSC